MFGGQSVAEIAAPSVVVLPVDLVGVPGAAVSSAPRPWRTWPGASSAPCAWRTWPGASSAPRDWRTWPESLLDAERDGEEPVTEVLEERPEEEAEPEDELDEPPLPAMAEVQASARSKLAVVATNAVRWVIMV